MLGRFLVVAPVIAALAGCSESPTGFSAPDAPSFASVYREETPFTAEWSGCSELLYAEGLSREVVTENTLPSGDYQINFHYQKHGTAVAPVSGRRYVFNESSEYVFKTSSLPSTFTAVFRIKLIGQGDAPDLRVGGVQHITVAPDGRTSSWVDEFSYTCR
jgi:hypothetical protein